MALPCQQLGQQWISVDFLLYGQSCRVGHFAGSLARNVVIPHSEVKADLRDVQHAKLSHDCDKDAEN